MLAVLISNGQMFQNKQVKISRACLSVRCTLRNAARYSGFHPLASLSPLSALTLISPIYKLASTSIVRTLCRSFSFFIHRHTHA